MIFEVEALLGPLEKRDNNLSPFSQYQKETEKSLKKKETEKIKKPPCLDAKFKIPKLFCGTCIEY